MKSHNEIYLWTHNLEGLKPALYYKINVILFLQFGKTDNERGKYLVLSVRSSDRLKLSN